MIVKICVLLFMGGALLGAPPESLALQELRLSLESIGQKLHGHSVELSLAQERMHALEAYVNSLKQLGTDKGLEKRTTALEKGQETLVADLKTLKNCLNETNGTLALCQGQLAKMEKQITADIHSLKTSLQEMLTLLQMPIPEQHTYVVQPGDSLGQIAVDHKTSVKILKELNNLTADTIFSGQKLNLP